MCVCYKIVFDTAKLEFADFFFVAPATSPHGHPYRLLKRFSLLPRIISKQNFLHIVMLNSGIIYLITLLISARWSF